MRVEFTAVVAFPRLAARMQLHAVPSAVAMSNQGEL